MSSKFNTALDQGYTEEEIFEYMSKSPNYSDKLKTARDQGYSQEEITEFLFKKTPDAIKPVGDLNSHQEIFERTKEVGDIGRNKAGRGLAQLGKGAAQAAGFAYDVGAILSKKLGEINAPIIMRQNLTDDLGYLLEQKSIGNFDEQDQARYDEIVGLLNDPEKMKSFIPKSEDIPSIDIGSLIDKGAEQFGVDLTPKDSFELAANWLGFIKNPAKIYRAFKDPKNIGNLKEVAKMLIPKKSEIARSAGAGAALQYAADNEFGPMGTMFMALLGDMAPTLAYKGATQAGKQATQFSAKKQLAKTVARFTPSEQKALQEKIIKDFREAGIQTDLGTVSGNNYIKWIQSVLAQSGLTGEPLDKLKKNITQSFETEYGKLADQLGKASFETRNAAGDALKEGLTTARDADKKIYTELYSNARERGGKIETYSGNVGSLVEKLIEDIEPGAFKSSEQKTVLGILNDLKKDFLTPQGGLKSTSIDKLINTKIALQDAINYDVQGGAKSLLKRVVKEIDNTLLAHGKQDPTFSKYYKQANAKFAKHAKLFRGKVINDALFNEDPERIFGKMNSGHGVKQIREALSKSPEGKKLYGDLARQKLEEVINNNFIDGTTNQMKFGKFGNLLSKPKNREILKELLGNESFSKLEKLSNNSSKLAETSQKFFNTSLSASNYKDFAVISSLLSAAGSVLTGNPWPLISGGGLLYGTKQVAKLISDPEFIRLVEDSIIQSNNKDPKKFIELGMKLLEKIKESEQSIKGGISQSQNK